MMLVRSALVDHNWNSSYACGIRLFFNGRLILLEIEIGGCCGSHLERCISTRSDREITVIRSRPFFFWLAVLGAICRYKFSETLSCLAVSIEGIADLCFGVICRAYLLLCGTTPHHYAARVFVE